MIATGLTKNVLSQIVAKYVPARIGVDVRQEIRGSCLDAHVRKLTLGRRVKYLKKEENLAQSHKWKLKR